MNRQAAPASSSAISVPRVPAWAVPRGPVDSDVEAAWMAGSALNSLDNLVRSDAPWHGAWRQRLALKAATATVKLMRRTEGESALRDAWYLRQTGDEPGPAGNVLLAWRKLAGRSMPPSIEDLQSVADLLGIFWADSFADYLEELAADVRTGAPAPLVAAQAATAIMRDDPTAEPLAWWMADLALSWRMGWTHAVPLLATQIHATVLRTGSDRRRARPDNSDYARAICLAAATGSAEACRLAAGIAQQAERLAAVTPKLRAKGAGEVIALLLSDDAVSGSFSSKAMSRWASRRLFERLQQLDAVRELSGRSTFRLYGL
ncbi:MAG: DUF1403 family protein [Hyphomicrobiaceae bacterium]|nr:DUF1403 family protein [Hyphomicrobiaceae bacterium]